MSTPSSLIAAALRRKSHNYDIIGRSKVKEDQDQKHWKTNATTKLRTISRAKTHSHRIVNNQAAQFYDISNGGSLNNHRADKNNREIPSFKPIISGTTTSYSPKKSSDDCTRSTVSVSSSSLHYQSSPFRSSCCSLPKTCSPTNSSSSSGLLRHVFNNKEGHVFSSATLASIITTFDVSLRMDNTEDDDHNDYDYCQKVIVENGKLAKLQSKIEKQKTEVCRNYSSSSSCKHGKKCIFAHSKEELRLTKLVERVEKGLIDDIGTFMTRPCHHFVSTGDCPFGSRCSSIHDPRVGGRRNEKYWLPHCTLANSENVQTSVYVEWYWHANFSPIHYGHPFGPMVPASMSSISCDDFLAVVSNKKEIVAAAITRRTRKGGNVLRRLTEEQYDVEKPARVQLLNDRHRLFIAKKMRCDFSDLYKYKFRPTHIIFDEVCMLVQTRAFCVLSGGKQPKNDYTHQNQGPNPREINLQDFDADNENHVIVREIAFGPILSPTDRHLALFFDIRDQDVHPLTTEQQKRCRTRMMNYKQRMNLLRMRKSSLLGQQQEEEEYFPSSKKRKRTDTMITPHTGNVRRDSPVSFDDKNVLINRPFKLCIPKDKACYIFVTELLENCYQKTCSTSNSSLHSSSFYSPFTMTPSEKNTFECLVDHFSMFHLPVNSGREHVDKETPVPKPVAQYNLPSQAVIGDNNHGCSLTREKTYQETCKVKIWESFVKTATANFAQIDDGTNEGIQKMKVRTPHQSATTINIPPFSPTKNNLPHITGRNSQGADAHDNEDALYYKEVLDFRSNGNMVDIAWDQVKAYYNPIKSG